MNHVTLNDSPPLNEDLEKFIGELPSVNKYLNMFKSKKGRKNKRKRKNRKRKRNRKRKSKNRKKKQSKVDQRKGEIISNQAKQQAG